MSFGGGVGVNHARTTRTQRDQTTRASEQTTFRDMHVISTGQKFVVTFV